MMTISLSIPMASKCISRSPPTEHAVQYEAFFVPIDKVLFHLLRGHLDTSACILVLKFSTGQQQNDLHGNLIQLNLH